MTFSNTAIDLSALPAAETVALKQINASYLKLLRIEWLINSLFLSAITILLIVFIPGIRYSWWWLIITLATVFIILSYYLLQEKSFPYHAFAIREHDVIYEKGWLIRSTKICPYNRVQNCSIQVGPLERKFGLASLTLYTAGSDGADMRIPGLLQEEAEQLRQYILSKINGRAATEL